MLFVFLVAISLTACKADNTWTPNENHLVEHLEALGYDAISLESTKEITFTEQNLSLLPHQQLWAIQTEEVTPYLNKSLKMYSFVVKGHPLDHSYGMVTTEVGLLVDANNIIGGWSFPMEKNNSLSGSYYSLNGLTAEEVQTNYPAWQKEWNEKY
ncbi:hypothetical protein [Mangrovibacillus cuniculi]|uniref:DUF4830 domain-containing protein n=1 Tax=Mangrovibacillus cuniculi TaxID=2593652 RepID=A0A7S8CBJ7_9BACI|nr:hypothetical protein [Mangrovibacillus cuniculi]QPC46975.1 hypothetical protein G8O30_08370 [Mangrovibacillus cuniculi]